MKKAILLNIIVMFIFLCPVTILDAKASQDNQGSQNGKQIVTDPIVLDPIMPDPIILDPVILQLKWFHQFQFAGYYIALDKGYYQTEGLDVTIRQGGPKVKVDQVVTRGEADFGVLASELIRMRIQGSKVVLLASIMQHSPRALIVRADSDIFSPTDLSGHPIMLNQNEAAEFISMFISEGIPLERLQVIGKDKTAIQSLINGKIAAMNGSIGNQPFVLENLGIPIRLIRPISYGVDFYGDSLFTSEQEINQHPKRVAAFLRASLQGWEYAMQHPEETIDLILAKYNPQKARAHLQFEAKALKKLILPDLVDIGHVNPNRVERIAEIFSKLGIVTADYSLESFICNPQKLTNFNKIKQLMWIIFGLCFLFFIWGTALWLFNKKLKKTVAHRTRELTIANKTLGRAMEDLRENEIRYRGLFEESPISLWEEDFSAIKIHIDQLKDSNISDFRSYFENHPEEVRACAQMVKIIDVNKATLKTFQAETKKELFKSLDKVFHDKSYEAFKAELIYLAQGKRHFELNSINQTLLGNEIQIILGITIVPGYEDTWSKVFISLSDITSLRQTESQLSEYRNHLETLVEKRTEELKEKSAKIAKSRKALEKVNTAYADANKELKEFAYIVSHDLKAPLRAISQLTHWISEDYAPVFDDEGKMQMDLIIKRVKRMDGLIDGILRYSRIGRVKEKEKSLDLNLLVNEVINNIASMDNVKISLENRLPMVLRDPIRMEQVFQNLIGNAVKFMDKKEGFIQIGCSDKEAFWEFYVADNGPGIHEKYYDKIFQIFQTLRPRDEHESTGIGLTLVKKIINLYGGSVWVTSKTGHGATFFFTLPKKGEANEKL
jgi:signal transduction histidine kinase/ABC-type nitrate/sulfonate/bicarbonate transport system substrate-binding protein